MTMTIDCFKAYDIRGQIPNQLNPDVAYRIGNATATFLKAKKIVLGRDIRLSSDELADAVANGIMDAGAEVIDIGLGGTEMVYFGTSHLEADGGIMVTASHNPADYNGLKIVREEARPVSADTGLVDIRALAERDERSIATKRGTTAEVDIFAAYIDHLLTYVDVDTLKPLKLVVNPGNGGAGIAMDGLKSRLPFEFIDVNYTPDGTFPNGIPNPMLLENQTVTAEAVVKNKADMGIAWDGDFDRCFLFDEHGGFIEGYYIVGLLADSILKSNPGGKIVHDPRLTWNTQDIVGQSGGEAVQSKSGGMIPWLLVAELMSSTGNSLSELVGKRQALYPASGEINLEVSDTAFAIQSVRDRYAADANAIDETDGVSLEFDDWRFNLRGSNTEPVIRLNVESSLMQEKVGEIVSLLETLA
jgi:phosphomannomutase